MATVLPRTTLCAIVRDEKTNPAGGIADFIHCIVPHVEQAVIVDTHSTDGTREILGDLQGKYPHMQVLDHEFAGFADARNCSLDAARRLKRFWQNIPYALVLDADERLFEDDFRQLAEFMKNNPRQNYSFRFLHIAPENNLEWRAVHPKRLFRLDNKVSFKRYRWESVDGCEGGIYTPVKIKHFVSNAKGYKHKLEWYEGFAYQFDNKLPIIPQISSPGFDDYKMVSPSRQKFNEDAVAAQKALEINA
jgi:glycosyltransferase involved in cell wall biosynthesis